MACGRRHRRPTRPGRPPAARSPPVTVRRSGRLRPGSTWTTCENPCEHSCGVRWDHPRRRGLKDAADQVDRWGRYILPLEFEDTPGWTMQNMLIVARLMIAAASNARNHAASTSAATTLQPELTMNTDVNRIALTIDGSP